MSDAGELRPSFAVRVDRAVVALNAALAADPRWETVLLPVSDGLTLLRKR